ncbi:MAG: ATP-binding cassette domain-containing protein [Burkholderiales bacterium]|nr:MAG: ATP-binding cassette domain-containing protein [Burkholderiales bacterium]
MRISGLQEGAPQAPPATGSGLALSPAGDPLLSLRAVTFRPADRTILDAIDFEWGGAGICALIGPNGAGKTVLLRTIHGLIEPDAGEVRFEGRKRPGGDLAFDGQALVFQHPSLFRGSALDNLLVVPGIAALGRRPRRERALGMLERVGLRALADAPALKLSGGERQRLALARAWLTEPRLLLLDEPTASLDPSATEQVEQLVRDIHASGCRVLMTSHNLGQVARLADEVVFIHCGSLLDRQATAAFFGSPRTAEARQFLQGALPWQLSTPA